MENIKFAFVGYDLFHEVAVELINAGWELTNVFVEPEMAGYYNSSDEIRAIAEQYDAPLSTDKITNETINELDKNSVDVMIVAGYGAMVPYPHGSIRRVNVHPTDLPVGKGPWPLPHLILKEFSESAVVFHQLTDELDSGAILVRSEYSIDRQENLESLIFKVKMHAANCARQLAEDFESHWRNATPQSGDGEYWSMPDWDKDRTIDFSKPIEDIERLVRAFGKFDTIAQIDGSDWIVQDVSGWLQPHSDTVGEVVFRTHRELCIAAKDGYICIRQYRLDPDNEGTVPEKRPALPN